MKDDLLKKLKIAINNEKIWLELKRRRLSEAQGLEQNEYVKRYLELCGVVTATKFVEIEDDEKMKMRIFDSFLRDIDPDETNKIFVYNGAYKYDNGMIRTNSKDAQYCKYLDIEQVEPLFIPIDECTEFEKENTIIVGSMNHIRKYFLKALLETSQEKAVTLVKTKYKR